MMTPDWHPADIIAALKKRGTSLAAVSRQAGLASGTLTNALARHWPKGEKLIADALGVAPEQIWPSRYPQKSPPHSLTELMAQSDPQAEISDEEWEWVNAPPAGKDIL
ncbi:hypothetical protein B6O77_004516 [Salmonella enterica subsp. enterica serovar Mississippi]|nr:hypothetical protein [Salmonella enterica subsp. enterica serovar Mississippi]